MLTPNEFSKKVDLSYGQVLFMCKSNKIDAIRTNRGHYKIPEKELDKFIKNDDYVSKEKYEEVIRENERLKTSIKILKKYVGDIDIECFQ